MAGFRVGTVGTAGLIAALALGAAALVSAAPASASLSYVESGYISTTAGNQGLNGVDCPPSSFTVGGGVFSYGSYGQVLINSSSPDGPSGWS